MNGILLRFSLIYISKRALTAKTKTVRALSAEVNVNEMEFKSRDNQIELFKGQLLEVKQELLKEVSVELIS